MSDVDSNAHIIMVPNMVSYNPGQVTYKILEESEEYYIIEVEVGGRKVPTAIEKHRCTPVSVTISGEIR